MQIEKLNGNLFTNNRLVIFARDTKPQLVYAVQRRKIASLCAHHFKLHIFLWCFQWNEININIQYRNINHITARRPVSVAVVGWHFQSWSPRWSHPCGRGSWAATTTTSYKRRIKVIVVRHCSEVKVQCIFFVEWRNGWLWRIALGG